MHDPKYTEMPNATHARMQTIAGSAISKHGIWNATANMYSIWN